MRLEGSAGQLAGMAGFGLGPAPLQSPCSRVPRRTASVGLCDVGTEGQSFPGPRDSASLLEGQLAPHVASREGKWRDLAL